MALVAQIPVLVVSGFLGSGKTTLVRRLLDDARSRGERVAVVSNELGELGIDRALLGGGRQDYVELEGGCVCCQLSDELVDTLERLRQEVGPERIVIETSGVALPYDTQLNLYRPPVCEWVGEDLAVVVVNAEQLDQGRDLDGTFADQASSADFLVLNKIDLVPSERLDELERRLREYEPDAPILHSLHCGIDPRLLFVPGPALPSPSGPRRGASERPHHHEDFEVGELRLPAGIDPAELQRRIGQLDALRAKGFVLTSEGPRVVQRVGPRVELLEVDSAPDPELLGRVVVIRRGDGPRRNHARTRV